VEDYCGHGNEPSGSPVAGCLLVSQGLYSMEFVGHVKEDWVCIALALEKGN
jgi:hypothetical protein